MKQIKREITKEQILYEITEEELKEIKQKARINGRQDIIGYISFAFTNFYVKLNIAGNQEFLIELANFLFKGTDTIKNTYGYSFSDYLNIRGEH